MAEFDPDICFCIDHGGKETLLRPFWSATGYANADFTPTPSFLRMGTDIFWNWTCLTATAALPMTTDRMVMTRW